MRLLSILTVTKAEPYVPQFLHSLRNLANQTNAELVIAGDGPQSMNQLKSWGFGDEEVLVSVRSKGYIESVLDQAVNCCGGKYIFRIDDDELVSPEMFHWLANDKFTEADHWKFPRAHLWQTSNLYITNAPLWPDHQTRLSVRKKAGARNFIHAGSPYGGGRLAPVVLEHAKFLVKTRAERQEIADRYDSFGVGLGSHGMTPFNLPEKAYERMELRNIGEAVLQAKIDAETFLAEQKAV
jgi:hypothetical protein